VKAKREAKWKKSDVEKDKRKEQPKKMTAA
jgi:hypothetical protein